MVPCRVSCFCKQQTLAFQTLPGELAGVDGLLVDHHCHYDDDDNDDDDVDTARDVLALARCWCWCKS